MKSPQLILLIVVLALAGAAAWFFFDRGHAAESATSPEQPVAKEPVKESTKPITGVRVPVESQPVEPTRVEVSGRKSGAEFAQGVKGRVVDPTGVPVDHAKVFLMPALGGDFFAMLQAQNRGVVFPPVARGETDKNGAFALGIERVDPLRKYEIRVITEQFVDGTIPGLAIQERDWYDAGTLKLERGISVRGLVTVAGSNLLPVANAEVSVKAQGGVGFPNVSPTPGREKGIVVKSDAAGAYRIDNVPAGIVSMSAVAANFARLERPGTTLTASTENVVNFELSEGRVIAGMTVDAQGTPVANVRVTAIAISSKTPINEETRSDEEGHFELIGLVEGPYQLSASVQGFVKSELKPVPAGQRDVQLVLEKQGIVRVKVYGKSGRLLSHYVLSVKSYFENAEYYGNTDIPPKDVRNPKDGIGVVEGLDPKQYALQVEAEGHAKAFSEVFQIVAGQDPPLLEVRMNEGGVIEGTVQGADGRALPGVTVATMPNHLDENPFTAMFQGMIPFNITRTQTVTDADGRYRIPMLNDGKYQLKFTHAEHFDVFLKEQEIRAGATTVVPILRMETGTVVSGSVRVDGVPSGQVKVTISSVPDPAKPGVPGFHCDAISDNEGRFTMIKRVPPGRYQVMASRQTLPNPLLQMADFAKTKQEFELPRGQATHVLNFAITTN